MEDPEIMKYKDWLDMQKGLAKNGYLNGTSTNADREYTILEKITGSRIKNFLSKMFFVLVRCRNFTILRFTKRWIEKVVRKSNIGNRQNY